VLARIAEKFRLRRQGAKTHHILVLVEEEIFCPVTYVRVVNHLQHAPAGWTSEIYVLPREADRAQERLKKASLVFMARCVTSEALRIASQARSASVPVVYDIDDYLWRLPEYLDAKNGALAIDEIIRQATVVTTPSEALGEFIRERIPGTAVVRISNAANLPMPESPTAELTAVMANSDFFRLAGSKQALFEAMKEAARSANRRVWLYYLSNDPPEYCTDDPNLQIIWCGVRSYTSYRALLNKFKPDLALVPLPEDHFSRYKSVIKFAEFGASGIATIFSDVEPYRGFVRHGVDGWLSGNSPAEWRQTMHAVFSLPNDELRLVSERARERSLGQFSSTSVRQELFALFSSLKTEKVSYDRGGISLPQPQNFTFQEAYSYIVDVWRNSSSHRKA
jgi:hypothetical protein